MSSENYDETKIDKTNLGAVWERVALFVKMITGNVNVAKDGTLQEQIVEANSKIDDLESKVKLLTEEMEELGGTTYITSEDGSYLTTEDGYNIIAE